MARKNMGSISPIMSSAAAVPPMAPRVSMYAGMPTAAADPKQMTCLNVRFNMALFFMRLRSFGTETYAILREKSLQGFLFILIIP